MNKKITGAMLIIMILSVSSVFAEGSTETTYGGYGRGGGRGAGAGVASGTGLGGAGYGSEDMGDMSALIADIEPGDLSNAEIETLIYMYEEEKLAGDVYRALYESWNMPVFDNIARSEDQHADSVGLLLERYAIDIEAHPEYQSIVASMDQLQTELVQQGSTSLSAAFNVGATVEDLDIADILVLLDGDMPDDVKLIMQNLLKGSRNHMRSFTALLEREGLEYDATYTSAEYLEDFLQYNREAAIITDPDYDF